MTLLQSTRQKKKHQQIICFRYLCIDALFSFIVASLTFRSCTCMFPFCIHSYCVVLTFRSWTCVLPTCLKAVSVTISAAVCTFISRVTHSKPWSARTHKIVTLRVLLATADGGLYGPWREPHFITKNECINVTSSVRLIVSWMNECECAGTFHRNGLLTWIHSHCFFFVVNLSQDIFVCLLLNQYKSFSYYKNIIKLRAGCELGALPR